MAFKVPWSILKHAITHDPALTLWALEFNIFYCLEDKRRTPIQALQPTAVHTRGTPAQPGYPGVTSGKYHPGSSRDCGGYLGLGSISAVMGEKMGILIIYTIHRG